MAAIIQAENVTKVYRIGKVDVPALRGVSFSVEKGEFVTIVGPSGSGKSTLFYILGGLTRATSGRVTIDGADFAKMSDAQRTEMRKQKIGFVFQKFNLLPTLTAKGNIEIAREIAGKNGVDQKLFDQVTQMLGIAGRLDHRPSELSGGEQQRVALARAVVNGPALILADEPTGNLDSQNSDIVLKMLRDANKQFGQTVWGEEWKVNQAPAKVKPKFPHHMIREIYEQPDAVRRVFTDHIDGDGKIRLPQLPFTSDQIRSFSENYNRSQRLQPSRRDGRRIQFERMAAIDVEVDFASQYCYRDPVVAPKELTVFLSQSGTTIDTITALQVARRKHARSLAICNVPETPLTQLADATFLTHAGEEVAIAATKSFTTQLTALFLLAAYFGQEREILNAPARLALDELQNLPARMEEALQTDERSREYAKQLYRFKDFIFIGRDIDYPIALEGALKLKEVSYIHAKGYPTGELKHGPTALVNEQLPIVVLAAHDPRDPDSTLRYSRSVSNIREFIEREIPVLSIVPTPTVKSRRSLPACCASQTCPCCCNRSWK